jgi:adenylosuccinate synthase
MLNFVDIIFGLQWGDEGKGKISNAISKDYDIVCRWNGGPNAGHTVYINDKKYKTHIIPCGVFQNKLSIIGPNCVINLDKFYDEIDYLKSEGFDTNLIKVSPKAHIITNRHVLYDKIHLQEKLGTTAQGIAPAYSDKMLRCGKLSRDYIDKKYLWDGNLYGKVLCEGAQSFWLDINYGDYPYVTSSETLPYSACSLGFSPKKIKNIIGVAKIYDTKSGVDPLFPNSLWEDEEINMLIQLGSEYGSTTGRKRSANWIRLNHLIKAINISGVTKVILNKCDIIETLGVYKAILDNQNKEINFIKFLTFDSMKNFIKKYIRDNSEEYIDITFSGNKSFI